uniref:EF-hand domain-containing protein n=1 Tax=Noctiluca scintillans TaxID=2966 RepID=A0A7S1AFL0_NOCSC|mmetsp:Transcript_44191/g.117043  ORF Transcript_44191/g.117043 Transcript_44191/m.117043 type:complete len:162 (+) Transcript_44191:50-535(+)
MGASLITTASCGFLEPPRRRGKAPANDVAQRIEVMIEDLFRLHDLNKDGVLSELELIKLNEKIALLHYGSDADKNAVKEKYKELFRTKLDPNGEPVAFQTFQRYMHNLLNDLDRDVRAQEMILEQFIEEAHSGRAAFHMTSLQSHTDAPFLSKIETLLDKR